MRTIASDVSGGGGGGGEYTRVVFGGKIPIPREVVVGGDFHACLNARKIQAPTSHAEIEIEFLRSRLYSIFLPFFSFLFFFFSVKIFVTGCRARWRVASWQNTISKFLSSLMPIQRWIENLKE